jgi:hypothetical protein
VSAAQGRSRCTGPGHQPAGRKRAEVTVTFGPPPGGQGDALWPGRWGQVAAMCTDCWQITRTVATARQPGLVIHDTRRACDQQA